MKDTNTSPDGSLKDNQTADDNNGAGNNSDEANGVPIDRGWAWVVVAACFGMHVLVLGGVKSYGVLLVEFKDKYHVTSRELGMIQGIAMTLMIGLSLGANLLAVKFTCRVVVFTGGLLSALGFVLSAVVDSFGLLYLTLATITGLGFSLSYSPCVVMVGHHFKIRRSLANGISVSGSGVGSFVLPNVIRWLLNEYGLNGCLLLLGGLMLNVCVCALLFRPLSSYRRKMAPETKSKYDTLKPDTGLQRLMSDKTTLTVNDRRHHSQMPQELDKQTIQKDAINNNYSAFSSYESIPIASMQSIPQEELEEMASSCWDRCQCCKRKEKTSRPRDKKIQPLFDWTLLSNPLFIIYALSCAFGNFAYPNIFLMLPAHAESIGQDRNTAALLVSIVGITDLIGRVFFGWFSDFKLIPRRYGFAGSIAISALLNLLAPTMTTFPALVVYAVLFGFFAGSYMALISVMLADALGVEKLSSAYGLVMLAMSVGLLPGPLICGGIRDAMGSWDYSFVLCGVTAMIGSFPPLLEPCARRYVDARDKRNIVDTTAEAGLMFGKCQCGLINTESTGKI